MRKFYRASHSSWSNCTCNHEVVVFYDTSALVIFCYYSSKIFSCVNLTIRQDSLYFSVFCDIDLSDFQKVERIRVNESKHQIHEPTLNRPNTRNGVRVSENQPMREQYWRRCPIIELQVEISELMAWCLVWLTATLDRIKHPTWSTISSIMRQFIVKGGPKFRKVRHI